MSLHRVVTSFSAPAARIRSWAMAIAIAAVLFLPGSAPGSVYAASNSASGNSTFSSCYFAGSISYNTANAGTEASPYAIADTSTSSCAARLTATGCFWTGYVYSCASTGSVSVTYGIVRYLTMPTTQVYGYHLIEKPAGTSSNTIELVIY